MKWLCGPYDEMSSKDREELAKLSACGDPLQEAINSEALKGIGATLTVQRKRKEDPTKVPEWVVVNLANGNYITFAGIIVEGAKTREGAFEHAVRIGQKNEMGVVDLEAEEVAT